MHYINEDTGARIHTDYTVENIAENDAYDVTAAASRSISGYSISRVDGHTSGTITGDVTVTVYYESVSVVIPTNYYSVTVKYIDETTGEEISASYVKGDIREYKAYDVTAQTSLAIDGYEMSRVAGAASGTITGDVTVTVYYKPIAYYTLTVSYIDETTGQTLETAFVTENIQENSAYDATEQATLEIDGYELVRVEGETSGTVTSDVSITVYYKPINYYTITVSYIDEATDTQLQTSYIIQELPENSVYDVTAQATLEIDGYELSRIEGETSGTVTSDLTVIAYYTTSAGQIAAVSETSDDDSDSDENVTVDEAAQADNQSGTAAHPEISDNNETISGSGGSGSSSSQSQLNNANSSGSGGSGSSSSQSQSNNANSSGSGGSEASSSQAQSNNADWAGDGSGGSADAEQSITQQADIGSGKEGVSAVVIMLLAAGSAASAALIGSIVSDLRVLKWYFDKKRKAMTL